jgi:2-polyprenyl-3-methyl-5-hydroxy-6-metoxy-1,4-benzoquinol methylase
MNREESCDLCGSKESEFLFSAHDRMYNVPGNYCLKKCKKCGLLFIDPQPTEEKLAEHYPPNKYYSLEEELSPLKKRLVILLYKTFYSGKGSSVLKFALFPLYPLVRFTRIAPSGNTLDVGCGSGKFLVYMKYFNENCYGVEPGKFDGQFAKENGLKIKNCALLEADYPDNYFDVITLNHVFEHSTNPTDTLKKLNKLLKPEGTLVIAIPQSGCLAYRIFRRHWVQLDVPRHLFIFQEKTIREYARKTGFKIEKIRFNSTSFQFLGSLFYLRNRGKEKFLSDTRFFENPLFIFLVTPFAYFCNLLKIGDQIEIILRK